MRRHPPDPETRRCEEAEARHVREQLALSRRLDPAGAAASDESPQALTADELMRRLNAVLDRLAAAATPSTKPRRNQRPK